MRVVWQFWVLGFCFLFCYLLGASLRNIVIYSEEHKLQHPRTLLRVSLSLKCVIVSDIPLIFCENFVISVFFLFLNCLIRVKMCYCICYCMCYCIIFCENFVISEVLLFLNCVKEKLTESKEETENQDRQYNCQKKQDENTNKRSTKLYIKNKDSSVVSSIVSIFSFGHCVVCPLIYGFWLSLWYIQTFLKNQPMCLLWPINEKVGSRILFIHNNQNKLELIISVVLNLAFILSRWMACYVYYWYVVKIFLKWQFTINWCWNIWC